MQSNSGEATTHGHPRALPEAQSPQTASGKMQGVLQFLDAALHNWRAIRLLRERQVSHRSTDLASVERAYSSMSAREFRAVNGLQAWANRRAIPRILAHVPSLRPWTCVDLGCGSGDSTRVLLRHAPPGSSCIGYDVCGDRIAEARAHDYLGPNGRPARVRFVRQAIDEPLRNVEGFRVPEHSVDVVHSSGVVGHHLRVEELRRLGDEARRIIRPSGTVVLDAGPRLRIATLVETMRRCGFRRERVLRYCWGNPRGLVAFRPI